MKLLVIVTTVVLLLSGCATTKNWSATGGSRADGVIRLSYEYGMFEQPQVNEWEGIELARKRCQVWGYSGAEAFGGVTQHCNAMGYNGCVRWLVTKEYQCTNDQKREEITKKYNERKAEIQAVEGELKKLKSQLASYNSEVKKQKEREYMEKYAAYKRLVQDSNEELKRMKNELN